MRNYFPCSLVKECALDPTRTYVFGYHPHGVISTGMWINFCTVGMTEWLTAHLFEFARYISLHSPLQEANNVSQLLPGIRIHPLTMDQTFRIPFFRDILLAMGLRSVKRDSFHRLLATGRSVMVVPGGAREALGKSK